MTDASRSTHRRAHEVRARSRRALALVPSSGDVDDLVAVVGRQRGRPIRLLSCALPADAPSGLWVQTSTVDYVIYPDNVAAEYRQAVICHELAHVLLDHPASAGGLDTSLLAPTIDADVAARFFTRHGYDASIEAEAEELATRLSVELDHHRAASRQAQRRDTVSERLR